MVISNTKASGNIFDKEEKGKSDDGHYMII